MASASETWCLKDDCLVLSAHKHGQAIAQAFASCLSWCLTLFTSDCYSREGSPLGAGSFSTSTAGIVLVRSPGRAQHNLRLTPAVRTEQPASVSHDVRVIPQKGHKSCSTTTTPTTWIPRPRQHLPSVARGLLRAQPQNRPRRSNSPRSLSLRTANQQ